MPSTRISMCLICACEIGVSVQPSSSNRATLLEFTVPPFVSKVQPKLLCDSETDVAPDRHEHRARRMGDIPIHSGPNVHSGTHTDVLGDSADQQVAAAPRLGESGVSLILQIPQSRHWAKEPFASNGFSSAGT